MQNSSNIRHFISKKVWWALLVSLLVVAAIATKLLFFKGTDPGAEVGNSGSQSTKGEKIVDQNQKTSDNTLPADSLGSGDQKSNSPSPAATLLAPSGNFVSNHRPDQTHPTETSVCTTTPGANCQITFTKDGVTKSLSSKVTDRGGSAYWNDWRPSDIGLSPGVWKVQAIAELSGQTKSTDDAIELVVQ